MSPHNSLRFAFCRATRTAVGLLALLLLSGCGQHWMPSQRAIYANATAAIHQAPDVPADIRILPIDKCRFYIAKNEARVDIPIEYTSPSGEHLTDAYIVWMKRVARRWEPHRVYRESQPPPAG